MDHDEECNCLYCKCNRRDLLFEERKHWKIDRQKCLICNEVFINRIQAVEHIAKNHKVKLNPGLTILEFLDQVSVLDSE